MTDTGHKLEIQSTEIKGQLDRFIAHLESERGTRDRADKAITDELRGAKHETRNELQKVEARILVALAEIRQGLASYGRRKNDNP